MRSRVVAPYRVVGLSERPPNPTCLALPRPQYEEQQIAVEDIAPGGTFSHQLTDLKHARGEVDVWFSTAQSGAVDAYLETPSGNLSKQSIFSEAFLGSLFDHSTKPSNHCGGGRRERGLLGLAVDPLYPNPDKEFFRLFIYYTEFCGDDDPRLCNVLRRIDVSFTGIGEDLQFNSLSGTCDSSSQCIQLLKVPKRDCMHNGGALVFGSDSYLYVAIGDGGSLACHPQNTRLLTGKILRLNVHISGQPYAIPPSNPYYTESLENDSPSLCDAVMDAEGTSVYTGRDKPCPEIVANGVRNPYRSSFDPTRNHFWFADVGTSLAEEINHFANYELSDDGSAFNFGWSDREGPFQSNMNSCLAVSHGTLGAGSDFTEPVFYIDSEAGQNRSVIVGGAIYTGAELGIPPGSYVFGERNRGGLWAIADPYTHTSLDVTHPEDIPSGSFHQYSHNSSHINLTKDSVGFAEHDGELFILDREPVRLVNSGGDIEGNFPTRLEDTGCVLPDNPKEIVSGAIPYSLPSELWSDGATKKRYMAIPDGESIKFRADCGELSEAECAELGDMEFPIGTVLIKTFSAPSDESKLVETRLLMRHEDGGWAGYSYVWNEEQTAATLEQGGLEVDWLSSHWDAPSSVECLQCHQEGAGIALGPEAIQLNSMFEYPDGSLGNQLDTLSAIGLFESPPEAGNTLAAIVDPFDVNESLHDRARAYLHANCAGCHPNNIGLQSNIDLRYTRDFSDTRTCDVTPEFDSVWEEDVRLIAPGDPSRSLISIRMQGVGTIRMPPLATHEVDQQGLDLINAWILSLSDCSASPVPEPTFGSLLGWGIIFLAVGYRSFPSRKAGEGAGSSSEHRVSQ